MAGAERRGAGWPAGPHAGIWSPSPFQGVPARHIRHSGHVRVIRDMVTVTLPRRAGTAHTLGGDHRQPPLPSLAFAGARSKSGGPRAPGAPWWRGVDGSTGRLCVCAASGHAMAPRRVCLVRGIRVTGVGPQHAVCGASGTRDKA